MYSQIEIDRMREVSDIEFRLRVIGKIPKDVLTELGLAADTWTRWRRGTPRRDSKWQAVLDLVKKWESEYAKTRI